MRVTDDEVLAFAMAAGTSPGQLFPRKIVQEVACRECGAQVGHPCIYKESIARISNHLSRCFDRIRMVIIALRNPRSASKAEGQWTKSRPTIPGYYWFSETDDPYYIDEEIVHLDGFGAFLTLGEEEALSEDELNQYYFWSDPIVSPKGYV